MKPLLMMHLAGHPDPLQPLTFTPPTWTYSETLRILREHNPNYKHGQAGPTRRSKVEIWIRQRLAMWEALWGAQGLETVIRSRDGSEVTVRELLHRHVKNLPPYGFLLRGQIKALLDWVPANHPRLWARESIVPLAARGPKSTPYQLPRRNEPAARRWVRTVDQLQGMLRNLASWWCRVVIPLLRDHSVSGVSERGSERSGSRRGVVVTESRDHGSTKQHSRPGWLDALRSRKCRPEVL